MYQIGISKINNLRCGFIKMQNPEDQRLAGFVFMDELLIIKTSQ
jgi:hypothetical protein